MDANLVEYLIGPAGAAGLTLLLLLLRVVITRQEHERVVKQNDKLQQANDELAEANATLRESNRNLSTSGHLTNEVLSSLLTLASQRAAVPPSAVPPPAVPPAIPSSSEH